MSEIKNLPENQDLLSVLQTRVDGMERDQATTRLKSLLNRETFAYFEMGAILHRCHEEWYGDPAQYQAFVLYDLHIGLDKAARLRRTYLSIKAGGLAGEDLRGITASGIALIRPILESPKEKEHIPEFLEAARTLSVTALKDKVNEHLDRKPKGPKSPAEKFEASLAAFINGVEGDNLERAEQMLKVIEETLPGIQIVGEIRDKETGESRAVSLNMDEAEPQADAPEVEVVADVEPEEVVEPENSPEVETETGSTPMMDYVEEVQRELDDTRRRFSEEASSHETTIEAVV